MPSWTTITDKVKDDPFGFQSHNVINDDLKHLKENQLVIVEPAGTKNGSNKVFTLPSTPQTEVLMIMGSVMLLEADASWGFTRSATTVTLGASVQAPLTATGLRAIYGVAL